MHDLQALRAEIRLLQGERELAARQTRAEVEGRLDTLVNHYVAQGRKWAERQAALAAAGKAFGDLGELGPILGALLPRSTLKRIVLLSAVAEERADVAEIDRKLDELERLEEQEVRRTGADRRPDARPDLVLCGSI